MSREPELSWGGGGGEKTFYKQAILAFIKYEEGREGGRVGDIHTKVSLWGGGGKREEDREREGEKESNYANAAVTTQVRIPPLVYTDLLTRPHPVKVVEGLAVLLQLILSQALGVPDQNLVVRLVEGTGNGRRQTTPTGTQELVMGGRR